MGCSLKVGAESEDEKCKTAGGGTFDQQATRDTLVHKYKKTVRENCKKAVFGSIVGDNMQDGKTYELETFAKQFVGGTGCDWYSDAKARSYCRKFAEVKLGCGPFKAHASAF